MATVPKNFYEKHRERVTYTKVEGPTGSYEGPIGTYGDPYRKPEFYKVEAAPQSRIVFTPNGMRIIEIVVPEPKPKPKPAAVTKLEVTNDAGERISIDMDPVKRTVEVDVEALVLLLNKAGYYVD